MSERRRPSVPWRVGALVIADRARDIDRPSGDHRIAESVHPRADRGAPQGQVSGDRVCWVDSVRHRCPPVPFLEAANRRSSTRRAAWVTVGIYADGWTRPHSYYARHRPTRWRKSRIQWGFRICPTFTASFDGALASHQAIFMGMAWSHEAAIKNRSSVIGVFSRC